MTISISDDLELHRSEFMTLLLVQQYAVFLYIKGYFARYNIFQFNNWIILYLQRHLVVIKICGIAPLSM